MGGYFEKQYKNLKYVKASDSSPGLRNAQIGAIHAISSYFTISRSKSAIVVMPTGSGKTAVLMMSPYVVEGKKALIVTPSVMVRGQMLLASTFGEISANNFTEFFPVYFTHLIF